MRNIKLTISYKGTAYAGWQFQKNAHSIEEALLDAIHQVTGEVVKLYGAGRTDAGVHAQGQVANFTTASRIPPERFALALNTKLPRDIRVMESHQVPEDFHSRYSAVGKIYAYTLYTAPIESPFYWDYTWHIREVLDLRAMDTAARAFCGEHDFRGFMSTGSAVKSTVRRIDTLTIEDHSPEIQLTIQGNGFLYNMVRIITGTLVAVGMGKIKAEDIPGIIESGDREQGGITAPAQGLMLKKVIYSQ
ncbi:MAG: tRNA pseudouridine(38-40) synthase TruA [Eubacterium aggregans]|uniref:tRNA pseudouridine(38-40) synthase TruA n=1 Tax=Eubacterium aggregans TaxID=81409 RepID=UPI002B21A710|nr:tRNA pseudouridine(38-40) synthase TruA [Eubacterium aggregans]MEA5074697.1 tRNA pseudouridine(38-40) synthase TruA [Eubacterium aggregans]